MVYLPVVIARLVGLYATPPSRGMAGDKRHDSW